MELPPELWIKIVTTIPNPQSFTAFALAGPEQANLCLDQQTQRLMKRKFITEDHTLTPNNTRVLRRRLPNGELHGDEEYFFDNGIRRRIIRWDSGYRHGLEEGLHSGTDRKLKYQIQWEYGKRHGIEKHWTICPNTGIYYLSSEIHWNHGKRNGLDITYFPNNYWKTICRWVQGKRNGNEDTYTMTNTANAPYLSLRHQWVNGKRAGLEEEWSPKNVKIKEIPWINGLRTGTAKTWDENGKLTSLTKWISSIAIIHKTINHDGIIWEKWSIDYNHVITWMPEQSLIIDYQIRSNRRTQIPITDVNRYLISWADDKIFDESV